MLSLQIVAVRVWFLNKFKRLETMKKARPLREVKASELRIYGPLHIRVQVGKVSLDWVK